MRPLHTQEPRGYISLPDYAKQLGISHVAAFKRVKKGLIPARKIGRNYVVDLPGAGMPTGRPTIPYLSIPQLAAKLKISRIAVFQRIKKGEINAWKVGRNYVVPAEGYAVLPQPKELVVTVKKFMTIPSLAKELGTSRSTVYRKVKSGKIGAQKIGRNFAVNAQQIYSDMSGKPTIQKTLPVDYASTPQLAKQMGISRFALYRKLKKGGIRALMLGRNYVIGKGKDRKVEGKTKNEVRKTKNEGRSSKQRIDD